jgi:hypothetical protein
MTEEKRKAVRVWCDGWYDLLFNVSYILPGAQRNVFLHGICLKVAKRDGIGVTFKITFLEGVTQTYYD